MKAQGSIAVISWYQTASSPGISTSKFHEDESLLKSIFQQREIVNREFPLFNNRSKSSCKLSIPG